MGLIIAAFCSPDPIVEVAEADAMVTVFGILNLTEDSFFDESRRLTPPALSPRRSKFCESDQTSWMSTGRQPSGREACIAGR